MNTTLNKIRAQHPCQRGWAKLLKYLGKTEADDEPLPFKTILESNGLGDCIWCFRSAPEYNREWRLFAVWCARQVQSKMADQRSLDALDVAERFANGLATEEELRVAREGAYEAAVAARAAAVAAWTAYETAAEAAWAAGDETAAWAAWAAAETAAGTAAGTAAREAQTQRLYEIFGETE